MSNLEVQRILDITGFMKGSFPFRYLGIPICSKKISAADCDKTVEKMCSRIKIWGSRNMPFVKTLTLVNSVLMTLQTYCAEIMILHKGVFKEINSICRSFLWSGTTGSSYPSKIAWKNVCQTKKEGGTGMLRCGTW